MNTILNKIEINIYKPLNFIISERCIETEGKDYLACNFNLNNKIIICRNSKQTPKKTGQFVTFWKRNSFNNTIPFNEIDTFNYFVINVSSNTKVGQFVFPKHELIKHKIISSLDIEGKRGFRIYPSWDKPKSKQALKTQQWQLDFFYEINKNLDLEKVHQLYSN